MNGKNEAIEFGKYLKGLRLAADLAQKDVATKLGYSTPQFISNWERGVSTPPVTALKTLGKLYKIDAVHLLNRLVQREQKWVHVSMAREFARSK